MAGRVITPRQFATQWLRLPNKFEVNVLNFETLAGKAAVNVFQESFTLRRFNSVSSFAWPLRSDNNPWPLLYETGTLKSSIKVKKRSPKHKVVIWTDDSEFINSNRNSTDPHRFHARYNKNRDYAFCYAAIHNEGGRVATPGSRASHIRQRQFIGYSSVLQDDLIKLSVKIFEGFPK